MTEAIIHHGNCLDVMAGMDANSVDTIVTDPPYGLNFMGKDWDHGVPGIPFWQAALRVAKPGAHLLAFGGTRTFHRLTCAIEDAGWEIRDCVMWVYGSGFPKSADVSKMLDKQEQKQWLDVSKAIDNTPESAIIEAWKEHSKTVSNAGLLFAKSETATGMNTPKNGFVAECVLLQANPENSDAVALVAELSLTEARRISEASCSFVQSFAESGTTELRSSATSAASRPASQEAMLAMPDSSALQSAWDWQVESTADKLKAVEALKTWLGSKPSSRMEATSALCAALTDDLKLITLSQSKTFQSFDTIRQTACVSAISATITESTAASLISFTVDTLRSKAIDKAAGAERTDLIGKSPYEGRRPNSWGGKHNGGLCYGDYAAQPEMPIYAPATPAARHWSGYGTALKPAWEPVIVARKPLDGTVAENVLKWGTGAMNIDGCRVATGESNPSIARRQAAAKSGKAGMDIHSANRVKVGLPPFQKDLDQYVNGHDGERLGRWPANVIHDGSEEVVGLFPLTGIGRATGYDTSSSNANGPVNFLGQNGFKSGCHFGDTGSAARFFYTAKASKEERDFGLSPGERSMHPTVKPVALMEYLVNLISREGQLILDPFCGSGSTGVAAVRLGRKFVGIEQEAEYVTIATKRLEATTRQGALSLVSNIRPPLEMPPPPAQAELWSDNA